MNRIISPAHVFFAVSSLMLLSGCGSSNKGGGQPVKMSGGINEWLFDGNTGLMATSFEQDRTMSGQPVDFYEIKLTLKNHSRKSLTLDEVKTEYLAADLASSFAESARKRLGVDMAKDAKPFENVFGRVSNPDDPKGSKVAWTIKPNSTDNIQTSGHFYFATMKLQARVTLLHKGNIVGGPFLITLKDQQTTSADKGGPAPAKPTNGTKTTRRTFLKATVIITQFSYDGGGLALSGIASGGTFLLEDEKTVVATAETDKTLIEEDKERRIKVTLKLTPHGKTVSTIVAHFGRTALGAKIRKATIDDKWESRYTFEGERADLGLGIPRVETYDTKTGKKVAETKNIKILGNGLCSGEEVCYGDDGKVAFRSTFERHAGTGLLLKETVQEGELPRDYHHYELVLRSWPDRRR